MNITPERLRKYAETCEGSTKLIVLAAASTIEDVQEQATCGCGICFAHNGMWCPKMPLDESDRIVASVTTFTDGGNTCTIERP